MERPSTPAGDADQRINLFHHLQILARWKRFLLINTGILILGTGVVSFLMPDMYKSTASIIPPKQDASGMGSTISQLTKDFLPSGMLGKLGVNQGTYNYLAILNSRTAMDSIVSRFDLVRVYDVSHASRELARKQLADQCAFDIEENGDISVSVFDESPQRAADMANAFVDLLNRISIDLGTREARSNREFMEQRYDSAKLALRSVEDSLRAFQQRYGIYALPEQTKAAIEAAAELKAQQAIAEVERGILIRSVGKENAETRMKQVEIEELESKLRQMKEGTGGDATLFVPFKDVPELGIRYLRLYRDFEIQNKILQLIIPMVEQARVDENKNVPVVLVLDRAVPSEKKDHPRRSLIILAAAILGFFLFSFIVMLLEAVIARAHRDTDIEQRLARRARAIASFYKVRM